MFFRESDTPVVIFVELRYVFIFDNLKHPHIDGNRAALLWMEMGLHGKYPVSPRHSFRICLELAEWC